MEILTIAQFILTIALLIIAHELGHFIAALLVGIEIEEFGIGFPPRALKLFTFKGVDYTLNWLPLGGFVRAKGEEDLNSPDAISGAPPIRRILFMLAGPLTNLAIGVLLFTLAFSRLGVDLSRVLIEDVMPNSPAAQAGIIEGDIILQANGKNIRSTDQLRNEIYAHLGESVTITYERDGEDYQTTLVPRENPPADEGAIGILMGNPVGTVEPGSAFRNGLMMTGEQIKAIIQLPSTFLAATSTGAPSDARLLGYKGMYDVYENQRALDQEYQEAKGVNTLAFFASISISLGFINLLPLPALDGGRILFALPELIFKKQIPLKYQYALNAVSFFLLIGLMVYVNIMDFVNPFQMP